MPAPSLTTHIVCDTDEFRGLAGEWDAVLEQSGQLSYFLRWHWNWHWWAHFAPRGAALRIVCCRDRDGALVGVAPLYLAQRRVLSVIPVGELHLIGTGIPLRSSEYVDVFAKRGAEKTVSGAVAGALASSPGWDRLCLHAVPADTDLGGGVVHALAIKAHAVTCDRAPYVDTAHGWDHYKRTLGRSMRRNVEYYPRRLFQQHACEFEQVLPGDAMTAAVDALVHLHQARWRAAGQPGSFADPNVVRFLHATTAAAAADGHVRLWVLRIDGRIEAALVGFLDGGVLHYFQKGFNPAYAKADLGTVIVALSVKACCEDASIRAFDFMGGAGYKTMWARQEREMVRHEAWRPNPRTFVDRALQRTWEATARVYRATAPQALRAARRRWVQTRRRPAADLTAVTSSTEASRSSPIDSPS